MYRASNRLIIFFSNPTIGPQVLTSPRLNCKILVHHHERNHRKAKNRYTSSCASYDEDRARRTAASAE